MQLEAIRVIYKARIRIGKYGAIVYLNLATSFFRLSTFLLLNGTENKYDPNFPIDT